MGRDERNRVRHIRLTVIAVSVCKVAVVRGRWHCESRFQRWRLHHCSWCRQWFSRKHWRCRHGYVTRRHWRWWNPTRGPSGADAPGRPPKHAEHAGPYGQSVLRRRHGDVGAEGVYLLDEVQHERDRVHVVPSPDPSHQHRAPYQRDARRACQRCHGVVETLGVFAQNNKLVFTFFR